MITKVGLEVCSKLSSREDSEVQPAWNGACGVATGTDSCALMKSDDFQFKILNELEEAEGLEYL